MEAHQGAYFCVKQPASMPRRAFSKPALPISELISFLRDKGLQFRDLEYAEHCLSYIGYYRLKIYTRAFEDGRKKFYPGTFFEDVIETYDFDRRLRVLCLSALEKVEIALRAQIINVMGAHGGPHFYYEEKYFKSERAADSLRKLGAKDTRSLPIRHYKSQYNNPDLPPIWCLAEISTFGDTSHCFANLDKEYRKEISSSFGENESVCVSWIRTLSTLRNICAHHDRLWNADLVVNRPIQAKKYGSELSTDRVYSRMVIMRVLLRRIDHQRGSKWIQDLKYLIDDRPRKVRLEDLGFDGGWNETPDWGIVYPDNI